MGFGNFSKNPRFVARSLDMNNFIFKAKDEIWKFFQ